MFAHLRPALGFTSRDYRLRDGRHYWYPDQVHAHRREDCCLRGLSPGQVELLPGHGRVYWLDWSVVIYGLPHVCYDNLASILARCVPPWLSLQLFQPGARRALLRYRFRDDALRALRALTVPGPNGHLGLRSAWALGLPDDALLGCGHVIAPRPARDGVTRRTPHVSPDVLALTGDAHWHPVWRAPWHAGACASREEAVLPWATTDRLPDGVGRSQGRDTLSWEAAQSLWRDWGWIPVPPPLVQTTDGPIDPEIDLSAFSLASTASSSVTPTDQSERSPPPRVPCPLFPGPFVASSRWGLAVLRSRSPPFGSHRMQARTRPTIALPSHSCGSGDTAPDAPLAATHLTAGAAVPVPGTGFPAMARPDGLALVPLPGLDLAGATVPPRRKAPPPPSPCESLGMGAGHGGCGPPRPEPAWEPAQLPPRPCPADIPPVRAHLPGGPMVEYHGRPEGGGPPPDGLLADRTASPLGGHPEGR